MAWRSSETWASAEPGSRPSSSPPELPTSPPLRLTLSPLPTEATTGKWGPVVDWDIVPLHMSLMPNGKIFAWGKTDVADTMGMPRIWDPAAGRLHGLPEMTRAMDMLFCAGHTLMPDGRLMVSGGHHMDDAGIKTTYFFSQDGASDQGARHGQRPLVSHRDRADGRQVLTMAGRNEAKHVVRTPEIWNGGAWSRADRRGHPGDPLLPPELRRSQERPGLLRQRAGPVALVQCGWDRAVVAAGAGVLARRTSAVTTGTTVPP